MSDYRGRPEVTGRAWTECCWLHLRIKNPGRGLVGTPRAPTSQGQITIFYALDCRKPERTCVCLADCHTGRRRLAFAHIFSAQVSTSVTLESRLWLRAFVR